MRIVVALLLVAAAPARADTPAKAVEKLVVANLTGVGNREATDKLGFAKERTAVVGMAEWFPDDIGLGALFNMAGGKVVFKLGAPAIAIGDGFAWFQLPYDIHVQPSDPMMTGDARPFDGKQRAGGVAIQTPTGWAIAAIHYAELTSDKELFDATNLRHNGGKMPTETRFSGDAALAKEIAGWFPSGLGSHAASKGLLMASGTAPTESQTGAATAALVKEWDKLGLVATEVKARIVVPGKVAFATIDVHMPRKGGGDSIQMVLTVVLVREGASWRWVSLEFSA